MNITSAGITSGIIFWCAVILAGETLPPPDQDRAPHEKSSEPGTFEYILPHVISGDGRETFVTLLNPDSTRAAHATIAGWDGEGMLVGEVAATLPAWNKLRPDLPAWFGQEAGRVTWLRIRADLPLQVLAEILGKGTHSAYRASPGPSAMLFLPHVARNTARFETLLAAVETDASIASSQLITQPNGLSFPLLESDGGPSQFHGDVRQIVGEDLSAIDWARLESASGVEGEGLAAMEYFTVLPERSQIAALGLDHRQGTVLRFPHIAEDVGQFWTGLVYINPGTVAANVVEMYYDKQGTLLASLEKQLAAGTKVNPIPLFDQNQREPIGAAWMEARSDQPLLGYELFGAPLGSGHDYFAGFRGSLDAARIIDFPYVFYGENAFTGLVAVNAGDAPADLSFTAIAADGEVVGRSETLTGVPAKAKVVRLARDLFSGQTLLRAAWVRAASPSPTWTGFLLWGDTTLPRQYLAAIGATTDTGEEPPILIDEQFADWDTREPVFQDPENDAGGGAEDLGALWIDNDDRYLFLRFEVGSEFLLQSGNDLQLFLDTDSKRITGTPVNGLGAELEYHFGAGSGTVVLNGQSLPIGPYQLQLVSSPTVSSRVFELALRRDLAFGGTPLFGENEIKILLRSGTVDQLPDGPGGLNYAFRQMPARVPSSYTITKRDPDHFRVLNYNVGVNGLFDPNLAPSFSRILQAIQPDIIGFEEIYFPGSQQTADQVEQFLPSEPGAQWFHASNPNSDTMAISRFPIKSVFAIQGNSAFLLDMRPKFDTDLLFLVAHLPCCENDADRQSEIDALMAFIREAKEPGGVLTLARGTPILIVGDMNLVGLARQQQTLLTGDILDETTFGPDFFPDWNGDRFADAKPTTTGVPMAFTWYNPASQFSPGRLDYVAFTASVLSKRNAFALFTGGLSAEELAAFGLQAEDTVLASDHLPVVVDFDWNPLEDFTKSTAEATRALLGEAGR